MSLIDLLIDGTIVQGILALGIVGAWLYAMIAQGSAPDALNTAAMLVLGAFFGIVAEKARARARKR